MNLLGPDVATIHYFWLYRLFAWRQWLPKDLPHESLSPLILPICLIIGLVAALILLRYSE